MRINDFHKSMIKIRKRQPAPSSIIGVNAFTELLCEDKKEFRF